MLLTEFSCPACRVRLNYRKPLLPGKRLVCPYCESRFFLPMEKASGVSYDPGHRGVNTPRSPGTTPGRPTGAQVSTLPPKIQTESLGKTENLQGMPVLTTPLSSPPVVPSVSPDLRKVYRRFAFILAATIVVLSAGFGTILCFVWRNRPAPIPAAELVSQREQETDTENVKERDKENRQSFRKLMIEGGAALAERRLADAAKAYQGALQLFPEDVEAAKGLGAARTAQEDQARAKKEEEKRREEFTRRMDQGHDAMKNRQFAAAAQDFDSALRLIPEDPAAAKALRDARAAADTQQAAHKKAADYESHMSAARAAMVGQRYADARNEFLAALQNKPDDPAALDGHKQAEKRLNELQEEAQRQTDFNRFMDQGDRALRNRRYEEAERAYTKAVALLPRNLDARNGLREAQKGLEKMKQDYSRLMQQGDLAMQTLRFGDAVRAYGQAAKLFPDDAASHDKLQTAQKALDDLGTAQANYNGLMLQGAAAMRLGRFPDAALAYAAALRLVPGDLDALAGLRSARAGMTLGPPLVPVLP
jgi:cytochrome c-type biogenesis protein CcmH/NrfG